MEKRILIASSVSDEHAYGPVTEIIEQKGHKVILYLTDKVITGEEDFSVEVTGDGEFFIDYGGQRITDSLAAAWYRKINSVSVPSAENDVAKQLYINNEVRHLHDTIWPLLTEDIWLNPPDKMMQANRKLSQLLIAKEVGFSIPQTLVDSSWQHITAELLTEDTSALVVKMQRGVIAENNKTKGMYTTPLDKDNVEDLQGHTTPFPGMYQPFIEKCREWRVTAVGEQIFSMAIYTDTDAKDDWRKHQTSDSVRFVNEPLPDDIGEKCLKYLTAVGLRYGAFDLIETPDGDTVFLECNPNGQYGWLEEELGFPISNAIADELIKIANS